MGTRDRRKIYWKNEDWKGWSDRRRLYENKILKIVIFHLCLSFYIFQLSWLFPFYYTLSLYFERKNRKLKTKNGMIIKMGEYFLSLSFLLPSSALYCSFSPCCLIRELRVWSKEKEKEKWLLKWVNCLYFFNYNLNIGEFRGMTI